MSGMFKSCLLSTLLLLGACGGGSSSGGGEAAGESASGTGTVPTGDSGDAGIAGTYIGPGTVTVSGGGLSETVTDTIQIRITEDDRIEFGEAGEPSVGNTSLNANGDGFTGNVPASIFNQPGVECTGALKVTGTINGSTITGKLTGSDIICSGVVLTINGSFNLERVDASTQGRGGAGLFQTLRPLVSGAAR